MSAKTRTVDLRGALGRYGIGANPVPIIKDRYVVHHSNLGGSIFVYLDDLNATTATRAVEILARYAGSRGGAFAGRGRGTVQAPLRPYRRHRGGRERPTRYSATLGSRDAFPAPVPCLGSRARYSLLGYNGDFEGFTFEENRDIGRYVFEAGARLEHGPHACMPPLWPRASPMIYLALTSAPGERGRRPTR